MINGSFFFDASTMAGNKFAAAVPDVVMRAHGRPVAETNPSVRKALPRSSKWTNPFAFGLRATASVSGADRDPGETQKVSTPLRVNSSTIRSAQKWLRFGDDAKGIISY